jgi:excisionase family DNA binding protein
MRDAKTPSPLGPTNSDLTEPLLLDVRTVARLLNVSIRTVRAWDTSGRLPAPLRLTRGCIRWRYDELRAWLAAGAPDRAAWEARRARK